MRSSSEILKSALAAATKTLESLANLDEQLAKAADLIERSLRAENKLLVCGNGGSAADAAHFATELVVRFAKDRRAYPAICLASDGGLLTAAGNDYGFDEIFARQVAAFGMPGDVLICLTTSGKSKNVQRALEEAKARKLKTIAFLGRDGGSSVGMADVDLLVTANACFQGVPPGEFRPGAAQFNKQESSADACPDNDQIAPCMVGEQLKCVNGSENQGDPFRHDPQEQFDAWINGGESNKNSKVQRWRTGEGGLLPEYTDREQHCRCY